MTNIDLPRPRNFTFARIEFLQSATTLLQSPPDRGIEIALVGRSNAGKSSALNALAGTDKLARTSKTPGRTQLMNFFKLDEDRRIVDLPGYGFAKVPPRIQQQIEYLLNTYLSDRRCLQGLILLMDIRHPLTPSDQQMINYAHQCEIPLHILLTKCDKLKRGACQNILLEVRRQLGSYSKLSVQTFSALKRIGLEEAQGKLDEWFDMEEPK